ncbi:MAG: hypothetical protein BWY06_03515 [Candidatus Latescibacteria bacterium ADurb.Bin168]|nr:MAG: hypothetical protein BWY06_03515 [Candidatus Latescibacteria bacterium ADurb.Bin168]
MERIVGDAVEEFDAGQCQRDRPPRLDDRDRAAPSGMDHPVFPDEADIGGDLNHRFGIKAEHPEELELPGGLCAPGDERELPHPVLELGAGAAFESIVRQSGFDAFPAFAGEVMKLPHTAGQDAAELLRIAVRVQGGERHVRIS